MTKNVNIVISADSSQLARAVASANGELGKLSKGVTRSMSGTTASAVGMGGAIGGTVAGAFHDLGHGINGAGKAMGGFNLKAIAMGTAITAIAFKALGSFNENLDRAITRLDTLNNYPRVMNNLGIGTEEASASISKLSDKLTGLPTTLDLAALSVQRLTSINQNVAGSTDLFLAMNNAIIAGGASADLQATALEQMTQAYSKGKPDMVEWRNMMMTMPAQLRQVAQAMNFASTQQLGEALSEGSVTMNDFMGTIMKLNREGVNGFASFEEQARTATGGVATSMVNLQTAMVRGLTNIMNQIGQSNIAGFFNGIANVVNTVSNYIVALMKVVSVAVGYITSAFGGIFGQASKDSKATASNTQKASQALATAGAGAGAVAGGLSSGAKSAKEIAKQLAGFDEMTVLTEPSSGGDGGGAGGGGGGGGGDFTLPTFGDPTEEAQNGLSKIDKLFQDLMNSPFVKGFLKVFESIGVAIGWAVDGVVWLGKKIWELIPEPIKQAVEDFFKAFESEEAKAVLDGVAYALGMIAGALTVGLVAWGLWNAIVGIATLVTGAFSAVMGLTISPFILIAAAIAAVIAVVVIMIQNWEKVKEVAGIVWNGIVGIWNKAAGWFNDNVVQPIKNAFEAIFTPIANVFNAIWGVIGAVIGKVIEIFMKLVEIYFALLIAGFKLIWETIKTVFTPVVKFFQDVWDGVVKIFTPVVKWFGDIFKGAWEGIKKAFSGVASFFTGIWTTITNIFGRVGTAIGNAVSGAFKAVVNGILGFVESFVNVPVRAINALIDVINKVPGISVGKLSPLRLPRMARGGVVDRATMAIIGENGREAVVPLENNTGWINEIASKLNEAGGGGSAPSQIIVKIGEETILDRVIDGINGKSELSGQNVIMVR